MCLAGDGLFLFYYLFIYWWLVFEMFALLNAKLNTKMVQKSSLLISFNCAWLIRVIFYFTWLWQLHCLALIAPCKWEKRCIYLLLDIIEARTTRGAGNLLIAAWRYGLLSSKLLMKLLFIIFFAHSRKLVLIFCLKVTDLSWKIVACLQKMHRKVLLLLDFLFQGLFR